MAIKKFVVGNFQDEAVLFPAVKKIRRGRGTGSMMYLLHFLSMDWIKRWD
jgi:hypothetical protein